MKGVFIILGLFFWGSIAGCADSSDTSEDKEINPRTPQKPDREFYGDSVYIISKKIDTVYSYGQWIDQEHIRRKRRADSLRRLLQTKKTD
jgi:hypothetical protein